MTPGEAETAFRDFRTRGQPRAMARVFDLTAQELLLVAANLARTGNEAEELVQQTFLVAIEHRARWDDSRPLLPWLLGILLRLHRAERRRRALSRERADASDLEALVSKAEADPVQRAEDAELSAALAAAIDSLPEASRDVLMLRLVHGLEPAQIAHALGRPLETVKTQLKRGKERLREALPRSLAALIALEGDGSSAMRLAVLRAAEESIAGSSLALAGGGALVMKSLIALTVALALGGVWWWSHGEAGIVARVPGPVGASATAVGERTTRDSGAAEPSVSASREALPPSSGSSALHAELAQLTVRVLWGSDGEPAPDVTVALWHGGLGRVAMNPLARSDANGVVRFEGLAPGPAWIGAERGGETSFELAPGEKEVELRIPAGIFVEGVVLDEHEQPVSGAEVWISDQDVRGGDGFWAVHAQADGRFALRDVQPKRALAARAPGRAPGEGILLWGPEPGERLSLTLHVGPPGARLRGILRAESGEPVAGAYVLAGSVVDPRHSSRDGAWYVSPPPQNASSDAEGRFAFDALAPSSGFRWPLWIAADGFVAGHEELAIEAPETWAEVTLVRGVEVSGVVCDESGVVLKQVEVSAGPPGVPQREVMDFLAPDWGLARSWTGADGAFQLGLVRPGTVELVASLSGTGEVRETVALVAGEPFTWNATLVRAADIAGVVVDERQAVQGLHVSANSEDGERQSLGTVVTDADGAFRFTGAARGHYTLRVTDPSSLIDTTLVVESVTPGSEDLELSFPGASRASARIVGDLREADGAPYEADWLSLERASDQAEGGGSASSCKAGRLETGLLPPGSYLVTLVNARSGRWTIGPFEVIAGETRDVGEHACPAPGRLELEVRESGGGAPSTSVHVQPSTGPAGAALGVDVVDGHASCEALQPGSYSLLTSGFDQPMATTRVEVRSGETTHATFELPPAFTRWIQFPRLPSGPTTDVQVEWRRAGVVLSSGRWGIGDGLRPLRMQFAAGHYEAELTLRDGRRATTAFDVSATTTGEEQAVVVSRP